MLACVHTRATESGGGAVVTTAPSAVGVTRSWLVTGQTRGYRRRAAHDPHGAQQPDQLLAPRHGQCVPPGARERPGEAGEQPGCAGDGRAHRGCGHVTYDSIRLYG